MELSYEQLLNENKKLQEQVTGYQERYYKLQLQYQELAKKYSDLLKQNQDFSINSKLNIQHAQQKQNQDLSASFYTIHESIITEPDEELAQQTSFKAKQKELVDFFSEMAVTPKKVENYDLLGFSTDKNLTEITKVQQDLKISKDRIFLIEGCFILQKTESMKVQDCIRFCYPQQSLPQYKQLFELMLIYTFHGYPIFKIQDDGFQSRQNQILFGNMFEDIFYVFQDNQQNKYIPLIMKKINGIAKRFIHAIVKPEIATINGQLYQTEVIYGFISPLALRAIFFDLNRTILKQIKYKQLKNPEGQFTKQQKFKQIGNIMKKVTDFQIEDFPIQGNLTTGVISIQLRFQSPQYVEKIDQQTLGFLLQHFNPKIVSKIIHFVLSQKHVLLVGKNRHMINEMFEIIRLAIYPFNWVFPIVYTLAEKFYPYLQSPMPILAGCLQFYYNNLPKNDFVTIFIDRQQIINDANEYQKCTSFLLKFLNKYPNQKPKVIKKYITRLTRFIQKGTVQEQLTQFHIDFMDTQLVSFYKQRKAIKHTKKKVSADAFKKAG